MALELCPRCGRMHYQTDPCRLAIPISDKSKAAISSAVADAMLVGEAWTKTTIEGVKRVDPPKRGRPRIHPDRAAYKAMKERERRARLRKP